MLEHVDHLREMHPKVLGGCRIDVPKGWESLLDHLAKEIEIQGSGNIVLLSATERWGRMMCSSETTNDDIESILSEYEKMSTRICMLCSKPAKLHASADGRWLATLCPTCANEEGFYEI